MPYYFSEKQTSSLRLRKITVMLRNRFFEFYSGSGVFSSKRIDKGSRLLAENAIVKKGTLLDMGCGIGVIGIAIAKSFPDIRVVMTDINKRAVKLAKKNLKLNNVNNVEVRQGNLFEPINEKFTTILINPPQKAGKLVCFEMIDNSYNYLVEKGLLQTVARHKKGGKELSKKMKAVFGNVKDLVKKGGYRIYLSEKN